MSLELTENPDDAPPLKDLCVPRRSAPVESGFRAVRS